MEFLKSLWNSQSHAKLKSIIVKGEVDKNSTIQIYRGTQNPTKCWDELKVKQTVNKVEPLPLDTPIHPDKLRYACELIISLLFLKKNTPSMLSII